MDDLEAFYFQNRIKTIMPGLKSGVAKAKRELEQLAERAQPNARLIGFCTDVIVPAGVLKALNFNCYNFHAGPPERPGYRPTHFAAHQCVEHYGVTLHRMAERPDTGEICQVLRFTVEPPITIETIEIKTYKSLLKLASDALPRLINIHQPLAPIDEFWGSEYTTKQEWMKLNAISGIGSDPD